MLPKEGIPRMRSTHALKLIQHSSPAWLAVIAAFPLLGVVAFNSVSAAPIAQAAPAPTAAPTNIPVVMPANGHAGGNCMMCHSDPSFIGTTRNGDTVRLSVDPAQYAASIHGRQGVDCIGCHSDQKEYPHSGISQVTCMDCHQSIGQPAQYKDFNVQLGWDTARALSLDLNKGCASCHPSEASKEEQSVHAKIRAEGNEEAPLCTDCHGSHDTTALGNPRTTIPETCKNCHRSVYSTYASSVHGKALTEGNADVPSCIECHGVHNVQGPRDSIFRDGMVEVCGNCHKDPKRMGKYGISTDVFSTYLDDFHGRTVLFFLNQNPRLQSNKATCYDCHGVHNILPPNDPKSTVYPTNLQKTCQQCHPDASIKFPQAWLAHYVPTWDKNPVLYAVNLGYASAMIPATIGGFLMYIAIDARKRLANAAKARNQKQESEEK